MPHHEHIATPADAGTRLDVFLRAAMPELSRARLQALIRAGCVREDDAPASEPAHTVKLGARYTVEVPPPVAATPAAQAIPFDVLYEDEELIVLDKPAGLVVHPAPGHSDGTLVNALLHRCRGSLSGIGGVMRPGIVHRLDKDVSGVMVAAKTDRAHISLAGQFAVHTVDRMYEALCYGVPHPTSGEINGAIGRHPRDRKKMAVVPNGGKTARTHYRVVRTLNFSLAWVQCVLYTGRTHQIRVHMSALGHSLIGDPLYHSAAATRTRATVTPSLTKRIYLHARRLGFTHPVSDKPMMFERQAPEVFTQLWHDVSER